MPAWLVSVLWNAAAIGGWELASYLLGSPISEAEQKQIEMMATEAKESRAAQTAFRREDQASENQKTAMALMMGNQRAQENTMAEMADVQAEGKMAGGMARSTAAMHQATFTQSLDQPLNVTALMGLN